MVGTHVQPRLSMYLRMVAFLTPVRALLRRPLRGRSRLAASLICPYTSEYGFPVAMAIARQTQSSVWPLYPAAFRPPSSNTTGIVAVPSQHSYLFDSFIALTSFISFLLSLCR